MEHQETEKVKIHLENIKERYEEEVERVKGLENELKEERARVEEKLKKIETEHQERPKSKESKSHEQPPASPLRKTTNFKPLKSVAKISSKKSTSFLKYNDVSDGVRSKDDNKSEKSR